MIKDIMKMDEMLMNSLKENDILKQRIDKAIEYIENAHFMNINYKDGLLKILKGDNEE